jgi:glycine cleavage system H lipoate-binding protein
VDAALGTPMAPFLPFEKEVENELNCIAYAGKGDGVMKVKDEKGRNAVGFNILEDECIWMKSGIVAFKKCNNAYDCNTCLFDKAMTAAMEAGKGQARSKQRTFREQSKEHGYADRLCRHMLTGRVVNRKCGNDFRCDICEFDQLLEDVEAAYSIGSVPLVEVEGYRYSDSYYYHDGHAWARLEYGGRVRVGIDDFAMKLLGRPDEWELPQLSDTVRQTDPGFVLRRAGNSANVLSPIDGMVLAVNQRALKEPALAHTDPYDKGWLYLVEPSRLKRNLESLHFGEEGKDWIASETSVLREVVLGEYGRMASTGAPPVDDVFGEVPEIGWERLVQTFLKT